VLVVFGSFRFIKFIQLLLLRFGTTKAARKAATTRRWHWWRWWWWTDGGTTTHQLQRLRLIAAQSCLATSDRSAVVICDAVGYFTTRPTRSLRTHYNR